MSFVKKLSPESIVAYFCGMKMQGTTLMILFILLACNAGEDKRAVSKIPSSSLPAPVSKLYEEVKTHPDSIGLRLLLVDKLDSIRDEKRAMEEMDKLIKKDSLNYDFWYRKAQLQEAAKDTSGAIKSYRYAVRIYPSPDAILASANLLAEQQNPSALVLCQQVAGLRMGAEYTAHCHFITGIYYARSGNYAKAITAFNQCIYSDYQYMEAYMEKGFILYNTQKTRDALQVFQTVCRVKNNYADGYYWQAKCYERLNDPKAAIKYYQDALTLDPEIREAKEALNRIGGK